MSSTLTPQILRGPPSVSSSSSSPAPQEAAAARCSIFLLRSRTHLSLSPSLSPSLFPSLWWYPSPSSAVSQLPRSFVVAPSIFDLPLGLTQPDAAVRPSSDRVSDTPPPSAALKQSPSSNSSKPRNITVVERPKIRRSCLNIGVRLGPTFRSLKVDSLSVDSIKRHNQVSGKGFSTIGPRVEAGSTRDYTGSLCAIVCNELFTDRHRCPDVLCTVVMLMGYVANWNCMSMDLKVLRLIRASFGITRLIGVSFGNTRLIRASFRITRLIRVSFGVTRLIRASFGITRLMSKGTARGRPTRGKKDVWYQSLGFRFCRLTYDVSLCFCVLMAKMILATRLEMPLRRGARRGGRGGRGRGAGRVQLEMQEQQQPAPSASTPVPVVPQVVPDQLSAKAKHLSDFRKYNPTTSDGSLEDPIRTQLWLSSLETIFRYMKCPEDQKVQCAFFMLTDRGTAGGRLQREY
ncbi:gag-protease polyprotein [Cucumis melo var. makuwa]|uniref:Gag-protease polyprotein n=1 Tax=Cucumis melo var. makuwa TaxID=1194695 RepID=A0A5D3B9R5_CUCMM|nr:gag-protease polyprotein [Cucumis melo var. makuwa]